jgi:hypothetical protein
MTSPAPATRGESKVGIKGDRTAWMGMRTTNFPGQTPWKSNRKSNNEAS